MTRRPTLARSAVLAAYHQRLIERYSVEDARSLGWTSRETQRRRFLTLWRMAGSPRTGSLLDVGCGLGDLLTFLDQHDAAVRYVGIDIRPSVIGDARARHPGVRFEVADAQSCGRLQERFDCVFASGLFGVAAVCSPDYIREVLTSLWQVTDRALVFNMNSTHAPAGDRKAEDFYGDPAAVLDFCLRRLSLTVHVNHGTARSSDCSVVAWRQQAPPEPS